MTTTTDDVLAELERARSEAERLADHLDNLPADKRGTPALRQASIDATRDLVNAAENARALTDTEVRSADPATEDPAADDDQDDDEPVAAYGRRAHEGGHGTASVGEDGMARVRRHLADARAERGRIAARIERRRAAGRQIPAEDETALREAEDDVRAFADRVAELEDADRRASAARTGAARLGLYGGTPGASEYREGSPLREGQSVAGFARAMGQVQPEQEQLSLQKCLRGMLDGDWHGAERERRAMSGGASTDGGTLIPTSLSSHLIDLARNEARVIQAGAVTFPMVARTVIVPRWTADPSVAWKAENAQITPSDPTLDSVTLVAKSLTCLTLVSRELVEDAENVDGILSRAIAKQIGLTIDKAALYGSGTDPEPRGVKNTTGVLTASMGANGAAPTSYDFLCDAVGSLRDNNENPTAVIFSPRTERELGKLKDSQQRPLEPPRYLDGLPLLSTNQVPNNLTQGTANTASDVFVGDFADLYLGVRSQLSIRLLLDRFADFGQIGVLAYFRGDVAVAHPAAFSVTSGVL